MLLDGRVAVVTGAGRGIGREYALCLAREGAAVVVNDLGSSLTGRGRNAKPADAVCEEIKSLGGRAVASYESVADFKGAARIVQQAVAEFGRLDILVNNAGTVRHGQLLTMTEADYDTVVAVHQKGTFNMARHAAPIMKENGYGRIINITSEAGLQGNPGNTNYGAAKAAVMGMTFVWALELAKYGITVNAFAPHGETRMTLARAEREGKVGRPVMAAGLNAPLVAYLASEQAGQINGQIFGRRGFALTVFQRPRVIASMWRSGAFTPAQLAHQFEHVLGRNLQPVGKADVRFDGRRSKQGH